MANTQMCPLLMAQYPFLAFTLQFFLPRLSCLQANGTDLFLAATPAEPLCSRHSMWACTVDCVLLYLCRELWFLCQRGAVVVLIDL